MTKILTISGSLRSASSNGSLLGAAARLAPAGVTVVPYTQLAAIPPFNPDIDSDDGDVPPAVAHWRAALRDADAVLISSPEYAHGLPGELKNALDWVVGSGELYDKPTGVLSVSAASRFAHPQLVEVLQTMTARVVPEATRLLDLPRRGADAAELAADAACAGVVREIMDALVRRC
ncbi:MAG: NADPH-dependent FMN reductase [Gemmatimonadota bacterium]